MLTTFPDYRYDKNFDEFIRRVLKHKNEITNIRYQRISKGDERGSNHYIGFDLNGKHYKVIVANQLGYLFGTYGVKELDEHGNVIHETSEDIRASRYMMARFSDDITIPTRDAYFDELYDRRESKKKKPENKTEWLNGLP